MMTVTNKKDKKPGDVSFVFMGPLILVRLLRIRHIVAPKRSLLYPGGWSAKLAQHRKAASRSERRFNDPWKRR